MVAKGTADFATSILALFMLAVGLQAPAGELPGSGAHNAPGNADSPYLVLISIDGFRWDYRSLFPTPALDRIARSGVRAESMRPVFPSLTFPNHYSIATGLYPAEHGIVHNHFPDEVRNAWYHLWDRSSVEDPRWYGGEPIWVTAEKSGLVTAAYYFVGTEAAIRGVSPSHWRSFDATVPGGDRVAQVVDWLTWAADRRPHLVTLYFEHVDTAGHDFGLGSPQLAAAVAEVDTNIGRLLDAIDEMSIAENVYVLVVSDHGQANYVDPESTLILEDHIDLAGLEVVAGGAYAWIYQRQPDRERALAIRDSINGSWAHGHAVLRDEAPADWRVNDSPRFPEIFVVPDPGYAVVAEQDAVQRLKQGDHGWVPSNKAMHGIFLAAGPGLPEGVTIGEVSPVEIYPLMLELLRIDAPLPATGRNGLSSLLEHGRRADARH
jgi:predicted AlkP superfamily pyrophosphatase or phosphodiesterase